MSRGTGSSWRPRRGVYGAYGGRFGGELLEAPLAELAREADLALADPAFLADLRDELARWAGRPTPLCHAPRLSEAAGLEVWLKREDLLHGGAHKTNNVVGQGLLARRMGKRRLVAETGAGQHGVATAMIGARLGLEVVVYMGAHDMDRQRPNVERMGLLGAEVRAVTSGQGTLKEAIDEALRDWIETAEETHYLLGTVCGPDPYPRLVRRLQEVIGAEARAQCLERLGGPPHAAAACVGGGSNAIGLFAAFLDDDVRLFGVEPAGHGRGPGEHGRTLGAGRPGLLHGARTLVLQDGDGRIAEAASIAPGLDYPGVGPEHAALRDRGRVRYLAATDDEALAAFAALTRLEGILPALESAHAVAFALAAVEAGELERGATLLVGLSGRGDKDLDRVARPAGGGR